MRKARFALAALALGAGLTSAGCGGEDHLSKSEFLSQGNAICAKGNKEIDAAAKKTFDKQRPSSAELNRFAEDTLIPSIQGQIDGIDDLSAPAGDEDQVNAIVDEAQSALDKGKADPSLLVSEKNDPFSKANKLANDYGLKACGGNES
jgi:hypothetical protein